MMKAINICRVCSSPADYNIFSMIPTYLHESPNEFLHWKKDISKLLEETTGLTVLPEDGFPTRMCALCISYLKHAATFRQQAIDNILSIKAAQISISNNVENLKAAGTFDEDEEKAFKNADISMNDLIFNAARETTINNLLNNTFSHLKKSGYKKFLLNSDTQTENNNSDNNNEETGQLKSSLNLLFDKEIENSSSEPIRKKNQKQIDSKKENSKKYKTSLPQLDQTDDIQTASSDENDQRMNYFSYKETNFQEDDVMLLDVLKDANIIVNIPEHFKERKCKACFRRFMFEDSYNEHKNVCLEYKFLLFIEEVNCLLLIRRKKAISPHEFIRRMVFSFKKTCKWLNKSCELFLPDLLIDGKTNNQRRNEYRSSGGENSSYCRSDDNKSSAICKDLLDHKIHTANICSSTPKRSNIIDKLTEKEKNPLLDLLKQKSESSFQSWRKSSESISHNEESYHPINNYIPETPNHKIDNNYNENVVNASPETINGVTQTYSPPVYPKINFSARCSSITFETNAKQHNNTQKYAEYKRIISLFESDPFDKRIADAMNGFSEIEDPNKKMIKCNLCDLKFSTIMHLDQHKIKYHTNIGKKEKL